MPSLVASVLPVCLLLSASVIAQAPSSTRQTYPATLWVPCEKLERARGVIKGPVLVAKKGRRAAKVRVESELGGLGCSNTTTLLIAAKAGDKFSPIHPQLSQSSNGNGMHLVDWSPDGRLLLTEFWQWEQAGNDAGVDKRILLFTADTWSQSEIDTTQFMADQEGRNCQVNFELLGFTADGTVAMRTDVTTYYEVTETPADVPPAKQCIEKHQIWAVDPTTQKRVRCPPVSKHNGIA